MLSDDQVAVKLNPIKVSGNGAKLQNLGISVSGFSTSRTISKQSKHVKSQLSFIYIYVCVCVCVQLHINEIYLNMNVCVCVCVKPIDNKNLWIKQWGPHLNSRLFLVAIHLHWWLRLVGPPSRGPLTGPGGCSAAETFRLAGTLIDILILINAVWYGRDLGWWMWWMWLDVLPLSPMFQSG